MCGFTQPLTTVGIGSAPNSYFMTRAALFGRGSYTYIGDPGEVREKMNALFMKLESPVLTDIELSWNGDARPDVWPRRIPDLYAGEPLLVALKGDLGAGGVRLSGRAALGA